MRVLVTGASGQVGSEIASALSRAGHDVVGLRRNSESEWDFPGEQLCIDIGVPEAGLAIARALVRLDAVVHAAACMRMERLDPEVVRVNCLGTQEVLWAAESCQAKQLVFFSSIGVIGQPTRLPVEEDHPVDPRSTYHATKLFGERLVQITLQSGLVGTSLRISSPVGQKMDPTRIFSTFVRRAADGDDLVIMGAGTRRQNYVDARDVARATERVLLERAEGTFNIAGSEAITNADLARRCVRVLESDSAIVNRGDDPHDDEEWVISIERASRVLAWEPVHSIEDSIRTVAEASA